MPSWLWTLVLFMLLAPLHLLVVSPSLDGQPVILVIVSAVAYFGVAILWAFVGDRTGLVRR